MNKTAKILRVMAAVILGGGLLAGIAIGISEGFSFALVMWWAGAIVAAVLVMGFAEVIDLLAKISKSVAPTGIAFAEVINLLNKNNKKPGDGAAE